MDGATMTTSTPAPGVYRDIAPAVYHKWDLASSHRLALLARSPAHLRAELDNPPEPSAALAFGEMVHACLFEPDRWANAYACAPVCDRRTKEGKAAWESFVADRPDAIAVKADDWRACVRMVTCVRDHPAARLLLDGRRDAELSVVFADSATGCTAKLRADLITGDDYGEQVADLKTCDDASEDGFWRAVADWGYDRQGAFYRRGLREAGRPVESVFFVMVEKKPPFAVGVYEMPADLMDLAEPWIDRHLDLYRACAETGEWPAYSQTIERPAAPAWLVRKREWAARERQEAFTGE